MTVISKTFNICDRIEFDRTGRAYCPSCSPSYANKKKTLALVPGTDRAYKCFRGCSPANIREALGDRLPREKSPDDTLRPKVHQVAPPPKPCTVPERQVKQSTKRLLQRQGEPQEKAIAWLSARGITLEMIAHFRIGLESRWVVPDEGHPEQKECYPAIALFIPCPEKPGQYYVKKRVAPWLSESERPDYLQPWSQYGVKRTIYFTYKPEDVIATYYCEGEWDAIMLGWLAYQRGAKIAVACSTHGCSSTPSPEQLEQLPGKVYSFFDRNDKLNQAGKRPGDEAAIQLVVALNGRGKIAQVPMPEGCQQNGWDVSDALNAGFDWEDFEKAVAEAAKASSPSSSEHILSSGSGGSGNSGGGQGQKYRPSRGEIKDFCQIAFGELYGDKPWIYHRKQFWYWTGTHYDPSPNEVETRRIQDFCNNYAEVKQDKQGNEILVYKYAQPRYVKNVCEWAKQALGIDPKQVNPPGLNCVDGVLQLSYDPEQQRWIRKLVDHDPSMYYLYAPQVAYNISPLVKSDACDRLLSALDAPQRDIFLKTIAASLDLDTVRRYKGRAVRALLMQGQGSNGKDALRETTAMMYGYRGMVGATLGDFQQYDQGRKFPLSKLDGALINWPSENADSALLDRVQSAKIAITGDPLAGEKKGIDEYQFNPKCVMLFNINSSPLMLGAMEAIGSRYAITTFNKTFKANPGPGELQADPRFLYDPEFVRTQVLPWYLHYVLDAADRLMQEGIDYSPTEVAMEEVREASDHIYAFCKDAGIGYAPNGRLYAQQVWEKLREWYIGNGTLEVQELSDGRTKDIWHSQNTWDDKTIRGLNQIFSRLLTLFPKAHRERDSSGRHYLKGIGFIPPGGNNGGSPPGNDNPTPEDSVSNGHISEDGLNVSEDNLKISKTSYGGGSEDDEAELDHFARVKKMMSSLSESEKQQLRKELDLHSGDSKLPPNHVQQVQNPVSEQDETSSGEVQTASKDVQKCNQQIQTLSARSREEEEESERNGLLNTFEASSEEESCQRQQPLGFGYSQQSAYQQHPTQQEVSDSADEQKPLLELQQQPEGSGAITSPASPVYVYLGKVASGLMRLAGHEYPQLRSIYPQQRVVILDVPLSGTQVEAGLCYVKPVGADWHDGIVVKRDELRELE